MRWFGKALAALVVTTAAASAQAETETTWMKVMIDGRKVGQVVGTRTVDGDRVTSTETMELVIERAGVTMPMHTEETSIESTDGKPLGFRSLMTMSGIALRSEGTIGDDGKVAITQHNGTSEMKRTIAWPAGAVMAEGSRLAQEKHGLKPGTTFRLVAFQTLDQTPIPIDVTVVGPETLTIDGEKLTLTRVAQRADFAGTTMEMQTWVDDRLDVRRSVMPMLGLDLEMVACDEACASAPNQPADILDRSMVTAPRALTKTDRAGALRYTLDVTSPDPAKLPATSEQVATGQRGRVVVDVDPTPAKRDTTAPVASERAPTRFLDSDDASVRDLAREATAGDKDDVARMATLERYVREYISNKSMRVGYASASQTVASREGDCTEHAVLLAAMGRALNIPTRVVSGLAYAGRFADRDDVFVPHAWTQAYVGGAWHSYDAALSGFDAGHIALSYGDGEPSGFYSSVGLLGYLKIATVEPAP